MSVQADVLYRLDPSAVREPPKGFWPTLRQIGPSLIITSMIIGSGELIMTTTLGARAGFVALWLVILSCFLKVAVQIEYGRHTIATGETTLEAFNKFPGPSVFGLNWSVLCWLAVKILQPVQYAGIVGGVGLALALAFSSLSPVTWTWITAISVAILVWRGRYQFVEKVAVGMVAAFSIFTVYCVVLLQDTAYRITMGDVLQGLTFHLPPEALAVGMAVFGITGISADEITAYPYWCLEKGYARFTGPRDDSDEWYRRARGWIRVMYLDAFVSMIIYTIVTAAFFLLGAAVLSRRGEVPAGYEMIRTLSKMYTESFGPSAMYIFLAGAIVVLYSTLFVGCASTARMFTDAAAQVGVLNYRDTRRRELGIAIVAWVLPILWVVIFAYIGEPVLLITIGALGFTFLLAVATYGAYHFRYRRLDPKLAPGRLYDVLLWLSIITMATVATWSIVQAL